jgi:excisionase family DNA binding protein
MSKLLSVQQAADELNLKAVTIRLWISQRRFPVVHCGRAVRIPADAIADFIERNTTPAKEARR